MFQAKLIYTEELKINRMINCVLKYQKKYDKPWTPMKERCGTVLIVRKKMKKKDKLELHIETHIEGFTHACVYCGKIHKTRGALKTPTSLSHRDSKLLF